jgi:hypothetical protein
VRAHHLGQRASYATMAVPAVIVTVVIAIVMTVVMVMTMVVGAHDAVRLAAR